jgi:hypothetical protein
MIVGFAEQSRPAFVVVARERLEAVLFQSRQREPKNPRVSDGAYSQKIDTGVGFESVKAFRKNSCDDRPLCQASFGFGTRVRLLMTYASPGLQRSRTADFC